MAVVLLAAACDSETAGPEASPYLRQFDYFWEATSPARNQRVIEWNGVPPDIVVPVSAQDLEGITDPVITAALEWLANR